MPEIAGNAPEQITLRDLVLEVREQDEMQEILEPLRNLFVYVSGLFQVLNDLGIITNISELPDAARREFEWSLRILRQFHETDAPFFINLLEEAFQLEDTLIDENDATYNLGGEEDIQIRIRDYLIGSDGSGILAQTCMALQYIVEAFPMEQQEPGWEESYTESIREAASSETPFSYHRYIINIVQRLGLTYKPLPYHDNASIIGRKIPGEGHLASFLPDQVDGKLVHTYNVNTQAGRDLQETPRCIGRVDPPFFLINDNDSDSPTIYAGRAFIGERRQRMFDVNDQNHMYERGVEALESLQLSDGGQAERIRSLLDSLLAFETRIAEALEFVDEQQRAFVTTLPEPAQNEWNESVRILSEENLLEYVIAQLVTLSEDREHDLLTDETFDEMVYRSLSETLKPIGDAGILGKIGTALQYLAEAFPVEHYGGAEYNQARQEHYEFWGICTKNNIWYHPFITDIAAAIGLRYRPVYYYYTYYDRPPGQDFIKESVSAISLEKRIGYSAAAEPTLVFRLVDPFLFSSESGSYMHGHALVSDK